MKKVLKFIPEVGVKEERELIIWVWFKEFPIDVTAIEWFPPTTEEDKDCCDCWLRIWSRGGDIGSDFILTGWGEEEGGGVLFEIAKWGIPL